VTGIFADPSAGNRPQAAFVVKRRELAAVATDDGGMPVSGVSRRSSPLRR